MLFELIECILIPPHVDKGKKLVHKSYPKVCKSIFQYSYEPHKIQEFYDIKFQVSKNSNNNNNNDNKS